MIETIKGMAPSVIVFCFCRSVDPGFAENM